MTQQEIFEILKKQLVNNFSCSSDEFEFITNKIDDVLTKSVYALSKSTNKYYCDITKETYDIFNSVQNTLFLYWLSHLSFKEGYEPLAARIYYLNKMLNAVELFYAVELPDIWICDHPLGSVMGRAQYHNYFSFGQGCTVGNNHGVYPIIGEDVAMMSDSKILGKSVVGDHCVISANTCIIDAEIPPHSIVFGKSPSLIIKPLKEEYMGWKV